MVNVDAKLAGTHCGQSCAQPILNSGIECDDNIEIFRLDRRLGQQLEPLHGSWGATGAVKEGASFARSHSRITTGNPFGIGRLFYCSFTTGNSD